MLSYRHAFHAGNHADVLKHWVEILLLDHLGRKDKPYWYIDTHAGAGAYALDSAYASKNAEYNTGIGRLWTRDDLPPSLADYVALVKTFNPDGQLRAYPGSPMVAQRRLRASDRMRLFELHSTDHGLLAENFAHAQRQTRIEHADGFDGVKAILPPPPRRALMLIDPPYEDKRDYARVLTCLKESFKRFATGCYAVWYPQLQRLESRDLPEKLKLLGEMDWLHVSLSVQTPSADGFGMHGSGMFVLNPPIQRVARAGILPQRLDQIRQLGF
jgi:23S rRNA (adenine2030-N6)-methyltransferase